MLEFTPLLLPPAHQSPRRVIRLTFPPLRRPPNSGARDKVDGPVYHEAGASPISGIVGGFYEMQFGSLGSAGIEACATQMAQGAAPHRKSALSSSGAWQISPVATSGSGRRGARGQSGTHRRGRCKNATDRPTRKDAIKAQTSA